MRSDGGREEDLGKELVQGIEKLDATEKLIQEEFAQFVGTLDRSQKKLVGELARLHHSLRGPEGLLDRGNYSRPFPPPNRAQYKPQD